MTPPGAPTPPAIRARKTFAEIETLCYRFLLAAFKAAATKGSVGQGEFKAAAQPTRRVARETDLFIWIRHNALKRPKSAKGIQGNASFFAWISLHLFGARSPFGCIGRGPEARPAGGVRCQALGSSPKPAASMARWVLFWKLASWPAAKSGTASAIARQTASTQPASDLAKSFRT